MIRIAVVEDEKECRDEIAGYIQKYEREHNVRFFVQYFCDGIELTEEYTSDWDIIFMDIKMKHMNGMDAARFVREKDTKVVLVFITSMTQYAVQGYEVDALDFVVKPLNYAQFEMKMKKAVNKASREEKYLILPAEEGKDRISVSKVLYVEVKGHNLLVVTDERTYMMRGKMAEMEELLERYGFVRCSQSYLVNLSEITRVKKDTAVVGEYEIPVSRTRRKQFLQKFSGYINSGYKTGG